MFFNSFKHFFLTKAFLVLVVTVKVDNLETTSVQTSITRPSHRFSSTTIDVCNINQSLVVSNETTTLHALTGNQKCSIKISVLTGNALSLNLENSDVNSTYSYFYIEMLGNQTQHCPNRYVLVSSGDNLPCRVVLGGSQFLFHFQHTKLVLQIQAKDIKMSSRFESISENVTSSCHLTAYEHLVKQNYQSKRFIIGYDVAQYPNPVQRKYVSLDVTVHTLECQCDCFMPCQCTLLHKAWQYSCNMAYIMAGLIIYEPNMNGLSFSNSGLSAVDPEAFIGLRALKCLLLDHNAIQALDINVFKNLAQLQVLDLAYNSLTNLTSGMFHSLVRLDYLKLNNNKLTRLPYGVFDFPGKLPQQYRYPEIMPHTLDLSHNNLVTLCDQVFENLTHIVYFASIDLSYNGLVTLSNRTFAVLVQQDGTLNLSNNYIATLSGETFTSLVSVAGTIDLSNNEMVTLSGGTFPSLLFLYGTIDMSYNNLETISDGIFASLVVVFENGTLDLSNNGLTTLSGKTFASLVFLYGSFDLRYNDIATISGETFVSLHVIEGSLDLSINDLAQISSGTFDSLFQVNRLDLSNNCLKTLPNKLFTTLQTINDIFDLSHNGLTSLSNDMFSSLNAVYGTLDLSHNFLHELPHFPSILQVTPGNNGILSLKHNNVSLIHNDTMEAIETLSVLDLSHNNLQTLSNDLFQYAHNLVSLNLKNNKLTINSSRPFAFLSALQILDLSQNHINHLPSDSFNRTKHLFSLDLSENSLRKLPHRIFEDLTLLIQLNLHSNHLSTLPSFITQVQLQVLDISNNTLNKLSRETFRGLENLRLLFLSRNQIYKLSQDTFQHSNKLILINASYNQIQEIDSNVFHFQLKTIDLRGNSMYKITSKTFQQLNSSSTIVLVDQFSSCCFTSDEQSMCISQEPRPEYLTCNRMLPYLSLRVPMWMIAIFALVCNVIAYYLRSRKRQANKVQTLLISQLALSDLLMGISMLILVISDLYYHEFFPSYAHSWRQGFVCKLTGFLSILSSEGSVFFVTLVSIDRMLAIKNLFGGQRLTISKTRFCAVYAWITAILISIFAIGLSSEDYQIITVSEVCIGIPIVRRHLTIQRNNYVQISKIEFDTRLGENLTFTNGRWTKLSYTFHPKPYQETITHTITEITGTQTSPSFSLMIFVGVNLLCFLIVAACYIEIFRNARKTSRQAARTQSYKEEIRMARRMFALVFTDFCCWVPLCIACILAQTNVIEIPPEMYAWIVGFVLPINSSINPILYVIYGEISEYKEKGKSARNSQGANSTATPQSLVTEEVLLQGQTIR